MKIEIEPTGRIEMLNGVRMRVWRGVTDQGVKCELSVAMVTVEEGACQSAFQSALNEVHPERQAVIFDNRFVV